MDKNVWLMMGLMILFPCAAAAQPYGGAPAVLSAGAAAPGGREVVLSTVPVILSSASFINGRYGLGEVISTNTVYNMPLNDFVDKFDDPENVKKKGKIFKVYESTSDINEKYQVSLPKGSHWRIVWKVEALEQKAHATLRLEVTSKADKKYYQWILKEISLQEPPAVGIMNVCLTGASEFTLSVEAKKAKWRAELQLLKD